MRRTNPRPNPHEDSRTTRVMAHLKDSLISQLKKLDPSLSLHSRHSALIERRLRDLFPAFHTPTHPPYALMIRSAILGLEDGSGSTEEAISEYIKREYSDLPWAHARILGLQLENLCEIGEIARVSGWRYVLKVEDEVKEQCEGSEKKNKRGKRRSNKRGETGSAEEECKKGRVLGLGKQIQQHQEVEPQRGLVESQNQDSSVHLETTCSSQPTSLECIPAAANPLSPAQLQQQRPCNGTSESNLDTVDKISGSLSLNVEVCKEDTTLMTVHHHQSKEREPSGFKQIADHEGKSLLPSCDTTVAEQGPNEEKTDERCPSQTQGQATTGGRGRRLHRNANCCNQRIHLHDQAEHLMCSSHSNQKESREAPNFPVNPSHNFGQQYSVPTSQGYLEGTISAEIKLPPTQVQHEVSSDIDLGRLSRIKASSTLGNVHDDQPQHYSEGSSKGNLDEGPMTWDNDQRPPKRGRGRPRKFQTVANCAVGTLLPSDDGNLHEHKPNINEMEKQDQYGGGRGLGRFGRGRGRGRGRSPTLNRKANQFDEQLQQGQSKQLGRGRGRGRRGRPPKPNENPIQYEKQPQQEDQHQQHRRGRGRPPKRNIIDYEAQLSEVQAKEQHVRARGRGRPPKPNQHANQFEDQLQSPSSGRNDNQSLEQKQFSVQSPVRRHESESGEAKSPAKLRQELESKYGSGEVSRSNVEENDNPWRLMPVQRKVQGIDGCWPLRQNQK
ncbi:hypothetical protein LR48_Vigan09g066100 [Vigna angularis]|nr:uncharacterized protein LOC108342195 [Vigna angularis]KOM52002.1 hypothetical protein LR48_Vigan09g066100 [Vigna angularis]BAT74909.1 hypothetical protein VIGAN_01268700 [Vigna angularis var. angularis]